MTGSHLQPVTGDESSLPQPYAEGAGGWDDGVGPEPPNRAQQQLQRYLSAVWRYKWLVLLLGVLGGVGGAYATRFIIPEYEVQARILLSPDNRGGSGATGGTDNMAQSTLLDLLVSGQVVDPVVTQLGLYVAPTVVEDSALFSKFGTEGNIVPGTYSLRLEPNGWQLVRNDVQVVDRGALGAPIGRPVGFVWQPNAESFAGRKTVDFVVRTPREASVDLVQRLSMPALRQGSTILTLRLRGTDPKRTEATLNAWTNNFVAVATSFKRYGVSQRAFVLKGQLEYAREALAEAEAALQNFKVRTATLPTESRIPSLAGQELTSNPIFSSYFNQQVSADQLRRDREWIERALTGAPDGGVSAEALLSVPSVNTAEAATKLRQDLAAALELEAEIRKLSGSLREADDRLRLPIQQLATLRREVIPNAARALLTQLEARGSDLEGQLKERESDLRDIPTRTIQLTGLERAVAVADAQYRALLVASQEAEVAEATTPPDISVLDSAIAPLEPTTKTGPTIILGAVGIALALGLGLAILLDMLDKRFRYAQQATDELGLFILGVIPEIRRKRRDGGVEAAQMVEAFRSIRMNMRYAVDPSRPFAVTISSPGPNDGKSLVSSNLALSFADGGARVVLVDGDIRRGTLEETFKCDAKPGLVEYLDGNALLPEVMRGTHHPNLTLIPCGGRQRRAPELLTGPRLTQLVAQLQREFDVVIIDSPPLGAGSDAYALGIAAGHMVVVLRAGLTDRKMARAKLATIETLPIRVLGGVLNSVKMAGEYEYYSYYLDYEARDEEPVKALPRRAKRTADDEVLEPTGD